MPVTVTDAPDGEEKMLATTGVNRGAAVGVVNWLLGVGWPAPPPL